MIYEPVYHNFHNRNQIKPCTCQVCGRNIKANSGVIAHHGYKRPGDGWQTASCYGARHLPYEEANDQILKAINSATAYINRSAQWLVEFHYNPPPTLSATHGTWQLKTYTANKPENFDPENTRRSYRRDAYDTMYHDKVYSVNKGIKEAQADLVFLRKRLSEWIFLG